MSDTRTSEYIDGLARFIQAGPSSYHAAAEAARQLTEAGFDRLEEVDAWPTAPGRYVVVRDGAVIAWIVPEGADALTPFRILGAHTDSPGFKLKPHPTTGSYGWLQAGVEVYGGPLLNSWLDRELELAGRIVTTDGAEHLVRTGPFLRIPQLAIHLDRGVNDGLALDKQRNTQPVWGVGERAQADLLAQLSELAGIDAADIGGLRHPHRRHGAARAVRARRRALRRRPHGQPDQRVRRSYGPAGGRRLDGAR